MGFIADLRRAISGSDKRDHSKPVHDTHRDESDPRYNVDYNPNRVKAVSEEYQQFDLSDDMNMVYIIDELRESGREKDARSFYNAMVERGNGVNPRNASIGAYLDYIMQTTDVENSVKAPNVKLTDNEVFASSVIVHEYSLIDLGESMDIMKKNTLMYSTLTKVLDVSHDRDVDMSVEDYSELTKMFPIGNTVHHSVAKQTRALLKNYPHPGVKVVDDIYDTPDLSHLYDEFAKDEYFKDTVQINRVYSVNPNKQSANAHKQGRKTMTLNSGTANVSLLKILHGGFKRPSELAREAGVKMSGQMFGDAVYFARPNQISKNMSYVDRRNPGSRFIIVADVHYDREVTAKPSGGNYPHNGHTLLHAKNIGRYSRDEYMVAPEQVEIKYVLEVSPGKLTKPKRVDKSKDQDNDVKLDLSNMSQDKGVSL